MSHFKGVEGEQLCVIYQVFIKVYGGKGFTV